MLGLPTNHNGMIGLRLMYWLVSLSIWPAETHLQNKVLQALKSKTGSKMIVLIWLHALLQPPLTSSAWLGEFVLIAIIMTSIVETLQLPITQIFYR